MWKIRTGMILFGVFGIWVGLGAIDIAKQAVWLALFGTIATGIVTEIYQQNGDDAGGWFMVYEYTVGRRSYSGVASAQRSATLGSQVAIVYLPNSPTVSNSLREVRLGRILGPLVIFPVGLVLAGTGVWLSAKGILWSSEALRKQANREAEDSATTNQ